MFSRGFKITDKKTFELDIEQVNNINGNAIVKMDYLAICKADLRYYEGNRDKRVLGLKYPMRLIHEAVGTVLKDSSNTFKAGDKVILVPNICLCESCDFEYIDNKYLGLITVQRLAFASSNFDGFSSEYISFPIKNLVKYNSKKIEPKIAVFSELISVAFSAIRRVGDISNKKIAIWGDGILGYILANVLKHISDNEITIIGKNENKLKKIDADNYFISSDKALRNLKFDIAFECVGGEKANSAVNEMLECVDFGGKIVLTGVSEEGININTRRILEKGVLITGSTRSDINDFKSSIELLNNNDNFRSNIEKLILSENTINNINDYYGIFEKECENRELGKNLLYMKL